MTEFKGRSESIFIVAIVFLCISLTAVCLRCFVRLRLVKAFGWDDGLMVFAMAMNIVFAACGIVGPIYGIGQRFAELDPEYVQTAMFWWWLGQMSYVITCVVAKVSIALALIRLTISRRHSMILWVVIGVSIAVGLVFWFMLTLQCIPVSYFWNRTGHGSCLKINQLITIAYVYSVVAMLCDFTLGLLPIILVWNLQMSRRTKCALAGILSMACVASSAVIVRIPYLPAYGDPDFLYATADISIWSNVEAGLGITAGSLVTVRPLFRWFTGSTYTGTYSSSGSNNRKYGSNYPLPSRGRDTSTLSRHDPSSIHYWRRDLIPENSRAVVVTTHDSQNSSQESLHPGQSSAYPPGVNVHKSFHVSSEQT